jgi:SAM-dependent methyltransferase
MTDKAIAIDGGSPQFYAQTSQDMPLFYDQGLGPVYFVDFAEDIARRTAAFEPLQVLEVAAGTGIVSRRLRDFLPAEAHLVVTDLNSAMLDVARAKFGPEEAVDFQPANALSLPFRDEGFDALICQFGVMFFPDKEKACREAYRVLASGGHYVFNVWDSERHNPTARLLKDIVARFCPVDPPRFAEVAHTYYRIDPVRDLLDSTGFTGVNVSVVSMQKVVEDAYSLARGQIYGSPLFDEFQRRGVDAQTVIDAFTETLLSEFGNQATRIPLRAIVFEARRP